MENEIKSLEAYIKEQYSPKCTSGYLTMIKRYSGYIGEKLITASYTDVLDYVGHLRTLKLHPKSLVNNLFCIKIYYRWLNATGQRSDHPCQYLYLKDQINKRIQVESLYSKQTLDELLKNHINKRKLVQRRDEVIISLLIYQAMTVQEITTINLEDINLKEAIIKAKGGRKQRPRTLALQANQILLLHNYITEDREKILKYNKRLTLDDQAALVLGNTGNRIFCSSINKLINTDRSKHDKLTPMKIRQSVIAYLLKSNNDLRIVQVFAGHKKAGSTEEYKQTGLEELKTLIQKLHPLENKTTQSTG
jgi:integrase/recombinase XerD